jgi:hypothetical protein
LGLRIRAFGPETSAGRGCAARWSRPGESSDAAFWTVEYLYTYGTPASGSLAAKFITYMGTNTAKDQLRLEGYTPCVDSSQNLMSTLCAPGAR